MAAEVGLVARLLKQHVADRSGRCRVCGDQVRGARPRWPCPLHSYATQAWERVPAIDKAAYGGEVKRATHRRRFVRRTR